jgi:hypothetical protein
MTMEEDLARLVRETVKAEVENHMRTRSSELIGRGGDVVLGGMGNIYLQPGVNKKAYYKGTEIGTGAGSGGGITGSGTINYIPRFTGATAIGDSHLVDNGSNITSSENITINPSITPGLYLYAGGVPQGYLQSVSGALDLNSQVDNLTIGAPSTKTVSLRIAGADKLTIAGSNISSSENITINPSITPGLYLYAGGVPQGYLQSVSGILSLNSQIDDLTIGAPSAKIIGMKIAGTDKLTIGGSGTTSAVPIAMSNNKITGLAAATTNGDALRYEQLVGVYLPLTGGTLTNDLIIKDATPFLYFTDDADAPLGSIGSTGAGLYVKNDVASGSIYIQTGSGAGTTRIQVYDTGVALGVPLVMGSNAITTNSTVDGIDVSAIPSTYLPLTGGTLTNDLTIKDANPMLYFTNDSDAPLGSIGSLGGGFYLGNDVDSGSIYIRTGATPATRIQVYDTGVALGVPLVMGSNAITTNSTVDGVDVSAIPSTYLPLAGGTMTGAIAHGAYDASFADGYGIDFRNDNVHKINYTYASNTLDFSTYQRFDFLTTVDSSVDFSILYDSIICHEPLYFRHAHAVSDCYIVDDASGTMELHVPTGQKLKVIIG